MHLLGTRSRSTLNKGKADERTVLDIPIWDFDDQGSSPSSRPSGRPGDTLTVSCTHDQSLRDVLPSFQGSRSATSSGARAPPTRCASASSWSPAPRLPAVAA